MELVAAYDKRKIDQLPTKKMSISEIPAHYQELSSKYFPEMSDGNDVMFMANVQLLTREHSPISN